jgi:putative transposase
MSALTSPESRLEELVLLRFIFKQRVSKDNPYSESLFRNSKYRPDYPRLPFTSKGEKCQWVASFAHWYNHLPQRDQVLDAVPEPQRRFYRDLPPPGAVVYEKVRQHHPRRWSRPTLYWLQPEVVWINQLPLEAEAKQTNLSMTA